MKYSLQVTDDQGFHHLIFGNVGRDLKDDITVKPIDPITDSEALR